MDYNKPKPPKRQNDRYLKDIFEQNFTDFLRFIFPNAETRFNFSKKIEFLDKEFFPSKVKREDAKGNRIVDLLAKVQTHKGGEEWVLVHTEIEGGNRANLPFRMLEYWIRIYGKYKREVQTVVFFTGGESQPKPSVFEAGTDPTYIQFRYQTCDIQAFSDDELMKMENPFAIVILACRASLLERKISDAELNGIRISIMKKMLMQGYEKERTERFLYFLSNMIHVDDPRENEKYMEEIGFLTKETIDMKTIELAKQHGIEEGIEKGWNNAIKKAEKEKLSIALNFKKSGLPIDMIAKNFGLSVEEVNRL